MVDVAYNPFGGVQTQQPTIQPAPQQPAATQEEAEERKGKWLQFFDQIDQDPNLRSTLISFGAQLLQPTTPGDTSAAALARGLNNSVSYLNNLRAGQQQGALDIEAKQAEIEATRAAARKTSEEADVVKPKASAAVQLNISQARNLDQSTRRSAETLEGDKELTQAQIDQIASQIKNEKLRNMFKDRELDLQEIQTLTNLWKTIDTSQQKDEDQALAAKQLMLQEQEIELKAKQLETEAKAGKLPAAVVQELEWYAQNITGGDKAKAAEMMVRADLAKALAGNPAASDSKYSDSILRNAINVSGFQPQEPLPVGLRDEVNKRFGEQATIRSKGNNQYDVILNGEIVSTVTVKE